MATFPPSPMYPTYNVTLSCSLIILLWLLLNTISSATRRIAELKYGNLLLNTVPSNTVVPCCGRIGWWREVFRIVFCCPMSVEILPTFFMTNDNVKWCNCKWTAWKFISAMPATIFVWGNRQHRTYFQWTVVMSYLSKWTLIGSYFISFLEWFIFVGVFTTSLASFPPRTISI